MIQFIVHNKNPEIKETVVGLLHEVNDEFNPPLNTWVDVNAYATKIANHAMCWLAYSNDKAVGFAACYVNKAPEFSFWTMLAISKEYRNQLIALQLESKIIECCKQYGSAGIEAEVDAGNTDLIKLHEYFGFKKVKTRAVNDNRTVIEMRLVL